MAIDYDQALALDIPEIEYTYTEKDTILYALGLGFGHDPLDPTQLAYVYESGLRAFPTMAVVLGLVSFRNMGLGIDYAGIVHVGQSLRLYKPLPVAGTVYAKTSIREVVDLGDRGAMVVVARTVRERTGATLAEVEMSVLCRRDGNFGGKVTSLPPLSEIPDRKADYVCDVPMVPQQALIYRLSGDTNPLHVDPEVARKVGFDKPILHGLATFGIVARAVVQTLFNGDEGRLRAIGGRFSAPVFPGETIRVEIWEENERARVRARVQERDKVVFNNGYADFT